MKTFKITNTTNLVGRRDPKYNTIIDVEYIDNRIKKSTKLNAGESVFLTISTQLPLSIHRLRIKGLITVTEITSTELNEIMKKVNPSTKEKKPKKKSKKKPVVLYKNGDYDDKSS
ncbi:MAG: hypothetical protein PF487_04960 [Bacteroidales bacterium]|jgi:hypothetical protein|nr:hypothetical protein [Bacteroidales bacterium]